MVCGCIIKLPFVLNANRLQFPTDIDERHARSFIIARISSLVTLDGTRVRLFHSKNYHDFGSASQVSSRERTDSELFYMSFINQQGHRSEDKRREEHPRWPELCDSQLIVG
jgi:hypothetical protein